MKKITLLGMLLFLANVTFAQQTHTEFGIKGGVSLATLKNVANNNDLKTGLHVGGLAHIHLSPRFALQPELPW